MKWKKENKTKLDGPDMDESPESNWEKSNWWSKDAHCDGRERKVKMSNLNCWETSDDGQCKWVAHAFQPPIMSNVNFDVYGLHANPLLGRVRLSINMSKICFICFGQMMVALGLKVLFAIFAMALRPAQGPQIIPPSILAVFHKISFLNLIFDFKPCVGDMQDSLKEKLTNVPSSV